MGTTIRVLVNAALIILTLYGCATFGGAEAGSESTDSVLFPGQDFSNRISVDGIHYELPTDWEFGPIIGEGVLFTFRRGEEIVGSLELVQFPEPVSVERFLNYYRDHVFVSEDSNKEETLESPQLGQVIVLTGAVNGRTVATAIAASTEAAWLVHISADAEVPFTSADMLRLIEGVEAAPDSAEYRLGTDRVGFVAADGAWRWVADEGDGFVAINTAEDDIVVGVRRVSETESRQIATDWGQEIPDGNGDAPVLRGAGKPFGVYQRSDARMEDVALLYRRSEEIYLLRLSQFHTTGEFILSDVLRRPAIQALLGFSVVFPDQEASL